MSNIHVWYHAGCNDGIGAKLAAYRKFGHKATYTAVNYHLPMPEAGEGSEVYILDFSYPKEQLRELKTRVSKLVVLDHHKTAQEALAGEDYAIFDMHKSGAVLAWEYFHPHDAVPELLELIQDRDLWKFHKATSRLVHAGILLAVDRGRAKDDVSTLEPYLYDSSRLAKLGEGALAYQQMLVKRAVDGKHFIYWEYEGFRCGVINQVPELASETGAALCEAFKGEIDYCISYIVCADGAVALSIRSKGDYDSAALAKLLGSRFGKKEGGGHLNAAGCAVGLGWLTVALINKE